MTPRSNPPTGRDDAAESVRFVEQIKEIADQLLIDGADRGDIKLIMRTMRELQESFQLLSKFRDRRKVTVFGSARTEPGSPCYQQALEFGRAMAQVGYMVITGAGPGIMEAGHKGAGTEMSIGINILLPFEQEANEFIADDSKLLALNFFFIRKLLFLKESDALVLFPGGFGTLDEGFEALTMLQTGKAQLMPLVMLDVPGGTYWEQWAEYIERCLFREDQMISEEDFHLYKITHSVPEAVEEILGFYRVYHSQRYVRGQMTLRLDEPISDDLFERINSEFSDILEKGAFERGSAHPHEANEPHIAEHSRLYFHFDRKSHGRLRQLIDLLNCEL